MSPDIFRLAAPTVELLHGLTMVAWGVGLPLLFWHRWPRLSRWYTWFAVVFVVVSLVSHQLLGECFLTTIARAFWERSGGHRDGVPFTVLFAHTVAGIRPTTRQAVLAWETAILLTSFGSLWSLHQTHPRGSPGGSRAQRPTRATLSLPWWTRKEAPHAAGRASRPSRFF